jgi:hypothetical protein
MKVKTLSALAGLGGALIATSSASANYTGLQVTSASATGGRIAYRVWAVFTDPNDYLTAISGSPTAGNMNIQVRNLTDSGVGSNFFNPLGGGATAPTPSAISQNPQVLDDTFVTIGVARSQDAPGGLDGTGLSPGFGGFGNINSINTDNAGWFTAGPVEQGRAGYTGDGDNLLRVLCMQLTVSSTSAVKGTIVVSGVNANGLAPASFTVGGQTFAGGFVPGPGALAILGLAGLVGTRRRRA